MAQSTSEKRPVKKSERSSPLTDKIRARLSCDNLTLIWRPIGHYQELAKRRCQRIFAKPGKEYDLALFYHEMTFYVMSAWCTHMGGPLYEGEIEDYKGSCHVMCPWHAFMFDLKTGTNDIGLKQEVYPVKIEEGTVYVMYKYDLALHPFI
ncbi:hypothetical protein LOTGIDRAFT_205126 [Lottia gigantea]|uniref:Rieske domain-containing protein n=1 Tax=Lottia gigantea TaxID=225164 RepID=V4CIA8_LOTGI|nr:hypothetical protein LOTGIDRAFT_205126 [Lottia gigantea]ESP01880.1 hypothetical protein LOTGIDRAFT_205126 [Lottia gigantea]